MLLLRITFVCYGSYPTLLNPVLSWCCCKVFGNFLNSPWKHTSENVFYVIYNKKIFYIGSIRISNELGAGNPKAARRTVWVVMVLGVTEVSISAAVLFSLRYVLGRAFVSDKQIVEYVRRMTPFVCLTMILDNFQSILSGVARGTGWQTLGACVNLGSYYVVGIPVAILLGFQAHLKAKGLWIGIVAGALVQSILLAIITCFTDWKKEVDKTRERVVDLKVNVNERGRVLPSGSLQVEEMTSF
ncbi:protein DETOXIFICATION 17-like [Apium graveolens]|uniref:protein DETOXIFICATION 17-like n=1 Tax=Apium graveolens TaxID=4045 RepID=UPI003D7B1C02